MTRRVLYYRVIKDSDGKYIPAFLKNTKNIPAILRANIPYKLIKKKKPKKHKRMIPKKR